MLYAVSRDRQTWRNRRPRSVFPGTKTGTIVPAWVRGSCAHPFNHSVKPPHQTRTGGCGGGDIASTSIDRSRFAGRYREWLQRTSLGEANISPRWKKSVRVAFRSLDLMSCIAACSTVASPLRNQGCARGCPARLELGMAPSRRLT
jgi:hypothetical protein